jgi:hypothetical protein
VLSIMEAERNNQASTIQLEKFFAGAKALPFGYAPCRLKIRSRSYTLNVGGHVAR